MLLQCFRGLEDLQGEKKASLKLSFPKQGNKTEQFSGLETLGEKKCYIRKEES